jgi:hypothetical protein
MQFLHRLGSDPFDLVQVDALQVELQLSVRNHFREFPYCSCHAVQTIYFSLH